MRRFLFVVGLLILAIGGLYIWQKMDEKQLVCLAKNVYFESRDEPDLGQHLVANATVERVRAKSLEFGGPTICDVVYHQVFVLKIRKTVAQFSWTLLPEAKQTPKDQQKWEHALQVARDVLSGSFVPDEEYVGAMWYMNPKISEPHNICWFRTTLVSVGTPANGNHEFFRRPLNDSERLGLMALDVPECKPLPKKKTAKK
jgi:spore germination cell wall hydrolase CwlJ-like protein